MPPAHTHFPPPTTEPHPPSTLTISPTRTSQPPPQSHASSTHLLTLPSSNTCTTAYPSHSQLPPYSLFPSQPPSSHPPSSQPLPLTATHAPLTSAHGTPWSMEVLKPRSLLQGQPGQSEDSSCNDPSSTVHTNLRQTTRR